MSTKLANKVAAYSAILWLGLSGCTRKSGVMSFSEASEARVQAPQRCFIEGRFENQPGNFGSYNGSRFIELKFSDREVRSPLIVREFLQIDDSKQNSKLIAAMNQSKGNKIVIEGFLLPDKRVQFIRTTSFREATAQYEFDKEVNAAQQDSKATFEKLQFKNRITGELNQLLK